MNIPFAFSANNHPMDAGAYQVKLVFDCFLYLRNTKTAKSEMVRPETGNAIETRSRLIFRRTAGRNDLTQPWFAGTSIHSEVVQHPKPPTELAQKQQPPPPPPSSP